MAEYFALTATPLLTALLGADGDYSIRTLSERERLAIEDYFFATGTKLALDHATTAVIVPQKAVEATMEDFAILVEFALGVLTISGFLPVTMVATITTSACTDAIDRRAQDATIRPTFPKKLVNAAASTWIRHLFAARHKTKDKFHITADRFVRYLKINNSRDALVDLCICLESLIESQTEISFRFATCLAKIAGMKNPEKISDMLGDLYDLRSKVVHGTDFTKEHAKVKPATTELRFAARAILTAYVLYLTEHTKDEWKRHLRSSLFK